MTDKKLSEEEIQQKVEEAAPEQVEKLKPAEAAQVEAVGATVEKPPEPGTMKIDLHCHSEASHDCSTPLELFPDRCLARGIRVQAITDHNLIWGAQKLTEIVASDSKYSALTIIIGEEVSTTFGEIVGLFLKEPIPAGLAPEVVVDRIKSQGGLVLIPHGFDPLKRYRLQPSALEKIKDSVDIIETFNARISRPRWNQAAVLWAVEHKKLVSAGSDAHTLADIGSAWVEVPVRKIESPADLLEALKGGKPVGKWTHPAIAFAYKMYDRTRRRYFHWLRHS